MGAQYIRKGNTWFNANTWTTVDEVVAKELNKAFQDESKAVTVKPKFQANNSITKVDLCAPEIASSTSGDYLLTKAIDQVNSTLESRISEVENKKIKIKAKNTKLIIKRRKLNA